MLTMIYMLGVLFNTDGLTRIVLADSSVNILYDRLAYFIVTISSIGSVPTKLRARPRSGCRTPAHESVSRFLLLVLYIVSFNQLEIKFKK
jgi:hypothetical protein